MGLSLQQLLTPSTEDESLASLLAILNALGFSATSWQSGSLQLTLVRLLARLHSDSTQTVNVITRGRFNDLATGDWLTLKAKSDFDNTRIPAIATQMNITLSDPLSVGPFTIVLGQLVFTDQDGSTYRNITAGTLPAGLSLTLLFQAEIPGADARPTTLVFSTPLAGVAFVLVTPIIVIGADEEKDDTLRLRNSSKWATLAYSTPSGAYVHWALTANSLITRAYVDDLNPRGPDTVDIYIAGDGGALAPSVATDVTNLIEGITDGIVRRPVSANVLAFSATNVSVSIVGNLYVSPSYTLSGVQNDVYLALEAYFNTIPLGGAGGSVTLGALYRVITLVPGVVNVNITTPTGDVVIGATNAPIAVPALTPVFA